MNFAPQNAEMDSDLHARDATMSGKHLTFALGNEYYGIPVLKIREIIRLTPITIVAQMPEYVRGVINLRGKIVPVIDLRMRFGFPEATSTERTCIVVVEARSAENKALQIGLVVDGVEEVINLSAAEIEEPPGFGAQIPADYIVGMAKTKGGVKTLINIDRLLIG